MYKLVVFIFSLFIFSEAIAKTLEYTTYSAPDIHRVTVTTNGRCSPDLYLSTKVGNMVQGTCQYTKETEPTLVPFIGPSVTYPLNGQRLTELVGLGYNCAATHAQVDTIKHEEGFDTFLLISDGKNYIDTDKREGIIALPLTCPLVKSK